MIRSSILPVHLFLIHNNMDCVHELKYYQIKVLLLLYNTVIKVIKNIKNSKKWHKIGKIIIRLGRFYPHEKGDESANPHSGCHSGHHSRGFTPRGVLLEASGRYAIG